MADETQILWVVFLRTIGGLQSELDALLRT